MIQAIKKRGPFELLMYVLAIVIVLSRFIPFLLEIYHAIPGSWIDRIVHIKLSCPSFICNR